jgi:SAM-dependent methyltransferase
MDASKAFAAVSEAYAAHRPTYPPSLFTAILDANPSLGRGGQRALAVDAACGSGQASTALAELFSRVVALDSCAEQVEQAERRAAARAATADNSNSNARRIEFRVADAHETGLGAASADLVAVAQALHWLDVPRFAREAARVLKPHGTLAAWTYGLARVAAVAGAPGGGGGGGGGAWADDEGDERQGPPPSAPPPPPSFLPRPATPPRSSAGAGAAGAADAALRRLYDGLVAGGHWDDRRSHVVDAYARLVPQLGGRGGGGDGDGDGDDGPFGRVETRALEMRAWRGVDELVGYVSSWSGVARARAARGAAAAAGEDDDPVAAFRRELVAALGGAEHESGASLELVTPITLVLASEPRARAREGRHDVD